MLFWFGTFPTDTNWKGANTSYTHAKHKYICSVHTILKPQDEESKIELTSREKTNALA